MKVSPKKLIHLLIMLTASASIAGATGCLVTVASKSASKHQTCLSSRSCCKFNEISLDFGEKPEALLAETENL